MNGDSKRDAVSRFVAFVLQFVIVEILWRMDYQMPVDEFDVLIGSMQWEI